MNSRPSRDASWHDLTPRLAILTLALRECRRDPAAFAAFAFRTPAGGTLLPGRVHGELQRFLSATPKALVELPRDHGKTVQLCARVVWELGTRPGLRVKIVCATDAIALQRAEFLREAIADNPRVRLVFPHLLPATPWGGAAFTVARPAAAVGPSVQAFGVNSSATGTRADLLVADDVVDESAIGSRAARDRVDSVVRNTLLNLLEPAGRFWSLSTPWHADDLTARLKANPAFGLFRRAVGPDLEPVWPEKWPRAALEARRAEVGAAAFARGYHLRAIDEGEVAIRAEWVKFAELLPRAGYSEVVVSVDPAVSGRPGADPTAVVVLGRVADGAQVHCLSARAKRVSSPDLVEWLAAADAAWDPGADPVRVQRRVQGHSGIAPTPRAVRAARRRRGPDQEQERPRRRARRGGAERCFSTRRARVGGPGAGRVVRGDDRLPVRGPRRPAGRGGHGRGGPARAARAAGVVSAPTRGVFVARSLRERRPCSRF